MSQAVDDLNPSFWDPLLDEFLKRQEILVPESECGDVLNFRIVQDDDQASVSSSILDVPSVLADGDFDQVHISSTSEGSPNTQARSDAWTTGSLRPPKDVAMGRPASLQHAPKAVDDKGNLRWRDSHRQSELTIEQLLREADRAMSVQSVNSMCSSSLDTPVDIALANTEHVNHSQKQGGLARPAARSPSSSSSSPSSLPPSASSQTSQSRVMSTDVGSTESLATDAGVDAHDKRVSIADPEVTAFLDRKRKRRASSSVSVSAANDVDHSAKQRKRSRLRGIFSSIFSRRRSTSQRLKSSNDRPPSPHVARKSSKGILKNTSTNAHAADIGSDDDSERVYESIDERGTERAASPPSGAHIPPAYNDVMDSPVVSGTSRPSAGGEADVGPDQGPPLPRRAYQDGLQHNMPTGQPQQRQKKPPPPPAARGLQQVTRASSRRRRQGHLVSSPGAYGLEPSPAKAIKPSATYSIPSKLFRRPRKVVTEKVYSDGTRSRSRAGSAAGMSRSGSLTSMSSAGSVGSRRRQQAAMAPSSSHAVGVTGFVPSTSRHPRRAKGGLGFGLHGSRQSYDIDSPMHEDPYDQREMGPLGRGPAARGAYIPRDPIAMQQHPDSRARSSAYQAIHARTRARQEMAGYSDTYADYTTSWAAEPRRPVRQHGQTTHGLPSGPDPYEATSSRRSGRRTLWREEESDGAELTRGVRRDSFPRPRHPDGVFAMRSQAEDLQAQRRHPPRGPRATHLMGTQQNRIPHMDRPAPPATAHASESKRIFKTVVEPTRAAVANDVDGEKLLRFGPLGSIQLLNYRSKQVEWEVEPHEIQKYGMQKSALVVVIGSLSPVCQGTYRFAGTNAQVMFKTLTSLLR